MLWTDVHDSLAAAINPRCPLTSTNAGVMIEVPPRVGYPLHVTGATESDIPGFREWLSEVLQTLRRAHLFTFENVPVTVVDGCVDNPSPEDVEIDFFNQGLVPMPFETTWTEYQTSVGPTGLLAEEDGDAIHIVEFCRVPDGRGGNLLQIFPWHQAVERNQVAFVDRGPVSPGGLLKHHCLSKGVYDPLGLYPAFEAGEARRQGIPAGEPEILSRMTRECDVLIYLLVMLGSRSTEIEPVRAPKFGNRKRVGKGLVPLPDSTLVRIVPRAIAERMIRDGERIHASPRMHWRRSHERTLPNGQKTVVMRHIVGFRALDGEEILGHRYKVSA